jgi:hypothetical protein
MPPTHAKKERNRLAKEIKAEEFMSLCTILADDTEFLALISEYIDFAILNAYVFTKAQATTYGKYVSENNAFAVVKSVIATYSSGQLRPPIQKLQQAFHEHVLRRNHARLRRQKKHAAKRIGFHTPSDTTTESLKNSHTIYLTRLSTPYPTPNAYVLEKPLSNPDPPKKKDDHSGKCQTLLPIDESLLQYTLPANKSAIFRDATTKEIIAVVIRDFARDSFHLIKPWAVNFIENSLERRNLCQRNGPGKMARVGVTDGARNARIFGWNRSLKEKFREEHREDYSDHERTISAGFSLFYGLFRAQAPSEITNSLEHAMTAIGLPRLDYDKYQQFPLPFRTEKPMTFSGYPLSPPEGYIACNFAKQIHRDGHLKECRYGAYWNIERSMPVGQPTMKHGANFFIAEYGLRIVNSENVCVVWDISLWHGTSWYYDDLKQVGMAFVLSPSTIKAWKDYKSRVDKGEFSDGFTLIEDMIEH